MATRVGSGKALLALLVLGTSFQWAALCGAAVTIPPAPVPATPSGSILTATPAYQWYPARGAVSYDLVVRNSGGAQVLSVSKTAAEVFPAGATKCALTPATALAAGIYTWQVRGKNTAGIGAWCAAKAFTVVLIPAAPVSASPSGTVITASPPFRWSPVQADSYELVARNAQGTAVFSVTRAKATVLPAGATQCTLASPIAFAAGTYSWQVRGKNVAGAGPWSTAKTFTVVALPAAPATVAPTGAIGTGRPAFKWAPVQADSYDLVARNAQGTAVLSVNRAKATVLPAGATQCTLASPIAFAAGTYSWQVRGKNIAGTGPWSAAKTFTVAALPAAPVLVAPTGNVAVARPTYQWNALANADRYELAVFTAAATSVSQTYTAAEAGAPAGTGTCSVTPATALANAEYSWHVRAINAAGTGPWSATGTFDVVVGWDTVLVPGNDFRIRLVTPAAGEEIDLTGGRAYEFAWTTNGVWYETPWFIYLAGNPANMITGENTYRVSRSENVSAGITHTGGLLYITAADIEATGVTTDNGFYHWVVAGWYGAHPSSQTFRIKK